ncbi:type VI secretion system ATPase TssH [Pseudomonas tolaasii]|uniref:Type VI secretion system ATPase TssH n=2 Tax=Pseudomonas tolaasii TaxID=29442 RepID=A0A7Y8DQR8_PSETO|nr:type VI secretion system ATPase TssH [Pseudomonas tolaasii]ARB30433.1 ClpV1 family T6SS ATPase [Pseudomonas tolaasii]KAB0478422.1 type VI secretion system ATPase TssH [Pseudomonas tolaasii]MBW4793717.1 type VI secretion system ATPase TssH [Pseudomonas tolaasii]MBY8942543.1 type VI secretion system ATPase TssH [Pseudomonas tolaasii]NWC23395.1 type VI secretion system ATPase TssH [Pseudomonas tolaasii]
MADISRVALFGKLNSLCYRAIESSTVFCKMRGNPYVELVHWLQQILQLTDSDLLRLIRHYGIDPAVLARDLTAALDRLPRGSTSVTDLSSQVEEAVERAWVYATLMLGESQVRSGHLLLALLKTPSLRNGLYGVSREFNKVGIDDLSEQFGALLKDSPEAQMSASDGFQVPGEDAGALAPAAMGKQEALKRFTVDLTEQARSSKMDPIVGRDEEIRQVIDILMRRRQNNPILVGEAGVGKTAVVEGFAQRIARGDVPPSLKDVQLLALDVGLLQAGASMKGEFEQRLRSVIDEVQASVKPIVLFIDETHTLVGAGGAAGTGDAANLLKPALARGTLRTVGATTFAEYKKHIEKDPALTRRFQTVQVDEPDEARALLMLRGIAETMQNHHQVHILDSALEAAVRLSNRYIPARQLPDKAVSLIDTACARVAISLHATPAEVDDSRRRIESLETELAIIERETAIGVETASRRASVEALLSTERERLDDVEGRWDNELALVEQIQRLRSQLADSSDREAGLVELRQLQDELAVQQGEHPLVLISVDEQAVASVVQDWTGIPVGRMVKNEIENVLRLADRLGQRIIGQNHALEMIARRIQTSRAGLDNPGKPVGVFMLAGTSGVGKTETALALAESLYGGEQNVITINMSEYQEAHTVSTLKGAPPGYVGYGEGGVLTEAVRRKPYSVVLLDEVEKAHPDVHELFFQVFDKGWMEDGEGRIIDFKNTLILLTTNAGTQLISRLCRDPQTMPAPDDIAKALREPLLEVFPPALLGRLVVIPYYPLSDAMLGSIIRLQLGRIEKRIADNHKIPFTYSDDVVQLIASRCTELESGGRMIDAILTNSMLPAISTEFLNRLLLGKPATRVQVGVEGGEFTYGFEAP